MAEIIGGKVMQRATFGNEAHVIPIVGTDTNTPGYGGTHPPIFIYCGFPVSAATVSFEWEYSEGDAEAIYRYRDERAAARIRVREPINPCDRGFYVDFGQQPGYNQQFHLRFNWIAVGMRT